MKFKKAEKIANKHGVRLRCVLKDISAIDFLYMPKDEFEQIVKRLAAHEIFIYTIYYVPNGKLDGTEEKIDSYSNFETAFHEWEWEKIHDGLNWLIQVSNKKGYIKIWRH